MPRKNTPNQALLSENEALAHGAWRKGTPGNRIVGVLSDYLKKLIPYIDHNCPESS